MFKYFKGKIKLSKFWFPFKRTNTAEISIIGKIIVYFALKLSLLIGLAYLPVDKFLAFGKWETMSIQILKFGENNNVHTVSSYYNELVMQFMMSGSCQVR